MPDLLTFVVLSAVTYRVSRFLVLDDLIAGWRDRFIDWLSDPSMLSMWRLKLTELLTCTFCITIWISAAVVTFWSLVIVDAWMGWVFLLAWPAVATGSLVFWRYIDSEG